MLYELSSATSSTFAVKVKAGKLYPFQTAGVEYICAAGKFALLADEMGLGKTPQSIVAFNTLGIERYIVICPASLQENWRREILRWSTSPHSPTQYKDEITSNILIMSYNAVHDAQELDSIIKAIGAQGLILDECQYVKNPKAKRTKAILRSKSIKSLTKVIAISGTPIINHPIDIYHILNTFCPQSISHMSHDEFGSEYSFRKYNPWTKYYEYKGARNEEKLAKALRSTCMVRRLKNDVLDELPDKSRRILYMRPPKGTGPLIEKELEFYELKKKRGLQFDENQEFMRVRLQLGLAKIDDAIEYIESALESEQKIAVFAHHREVLAALLLGLAKYLPVILTGGTEQEDRQMRVDAFQNDPSRRVFLGSIRASGVGHTLHAASHGVIVEASWVPGENLQAEDRLHRIGQKSACVIDYLVLPGSVDDKVLEANREKSVGIDNILN
jgi:SWI/SNF-related matrix-associated actin-dependent regulator 1 of chromatin subfamily A